MSKVSIGDRVTVVLSQDTFSKTLGTGTVKQVESTGLVLVGLDHDGHLHYATEDDLEVLPPLEKTDPLIPTPDVAEGVKHDTGKPPISLIPMVALIGMAKVFGFGAKKYGKHNYRKGMDHTRVLDAAGRHLFAIMDGEDTDPESKQPHWAHALCCIAMYAFFKAARVGKDDRYKSETEGNENE